MQTSKAWSPPAEPTKNEKSGGASTAAKSKENAWHNILACACFSRDPAAVNAWLDVAPSNIDLTTLLEPPKTMGNDRLEPAGAIQALADPNAKSAQDGLLNRQTRFLPDPNMEMLRAALRLADRGAPLFDRQDTGISGFESLASHFFAHPNDLAATEGFTAMDGRHRRKPPEFWSLALLSALDGHPELAKDNIANASISTGYGPSTLSAALASEHMVHAARWLFERGLFDPNQPDANGELPLGAARSRAAADALLDMGAEPMGRDNLGRSASERAQSLRSDERDAVVGALSKRIGSTSAVQMATAAPASTDGSDMARQIADERLLASALRDAKSEFAKEAKIHGSPCLARHPATGASALGESLRGGRFTTSLWLASKGSSPMEQDALGRAAATWLFSANRRASSGLGALGLFYEWQDRIDWSHRSKRGWPLACEAAAAAASSIGFHWTHKRQDQLYGLWRALEMQAASMPRVPLEQLCTPDGKTPIEVYIEAALANKKTTQEDRAYRLPPCVEDGARGLDSVCPELGQSDIVACIVLKALEQSVPPGKSFDESGAYRWRILEDLSTSRNGRQAPAFPKAAAMIAKNPRLARILQKACPAFETPEIKAAIEAVQISESVSEKNGNLKAPGKRAGKAL